MLQAGIKIHALAASLFLSSLSLPAAVAQTLNSGSALPVAYQRWLDQDVRYLISNQERFEFNQLQTDQQRDDFILAFWERRNPSPSSATNLFKEGHYRRLAYANSKPTGGAFTSCTAHPMTSKDTQRQDQNSFGRTARGSPLLTGKSGITP